MTTDSHKRGGGGKGGGAALTSSSNNPLRCHSERSEESPNYHCESLIFFRSFNHLFKWNAINHQVIRKKLIFLNFDFQIIDLQGVI